MTPVSRDLAAEQRAKRDAASLVERNVLEQHQRGRDRDLALGRLRRRIGKKPLRSVAAEHDVADRMPDVGVEQEVDRPPQLDATELNGELERRRR